MPRVMALDVGEKTIGVALSDETQTFAFPDKTILRHEGYHRDMAAVRDLVKYRGVEIVVVGMPLMMDGSHGIQAEKAREFVETLRRFVSVPVVEMDERLSTSEVEKMLISADVRRANRKQVVDSLAAGVVLQTYLDLRKREAGES